MKYLGRLYRIIDISRDTLIVLLLGFIIVAGAINILLRYGTDLGSFTWSDE